MNTPAILLSMATIMAASSCSLFKGADTGAHGTTSSTPATMTVPAELTASASKPSKKKDKNNKDAGKAQTKSTATKPTTEHMCGGEWTVTAVGDITITDDENVPYVNFAPDGRFYAFDGCNTINGDYVLRSDGTLIFDHVLSTMKYCPDVEWSTNIGTILSGAEKYSTDSRRIAQDTYIYLRNSAGKTVLTLQRHNMEFLNGNWQVTAIDGRKVDDEEMNIFVDVAVLKVHGNTGCNFFNGDLYIDPSRSNAIDFSNMALTRMACPKQDAERAMMVALEETKTAIAGTNDNTVLLLNGAGKEVLKLKRIPIPVQE